MNAYEEQVLALPPVVPTRGFDRDLSPRESIVRHGYAFVPGVLDPNEVRATRSAILSCVAQLGWLAPGTHFEDGIAGVQPAEGGPEFQAGYRRIMAIEPFHALGHAKALHDVIAEILAEPIFCLPNKIARLHSARPGATPVRPHQDFPLVQASTDTITAWVPLGDYTTDQGGLCVLARSHLKGVLAADWVVPDGPLGMEWHGGDFRAGDVVLFHSLTIHGSSRVTGERLRISADYRYQAIADPTSAAWLHCPAAPWPELYAAWSRRDLQYYWKDLPLTFRERVNDVPSFRGIAVSRLLGDKTRVGR
jgi:hypothetical protein